MLTCGKQTDVGRHAGPIDREWFGRVLRDPDVQLPAIDVRLTFTSEQGRKLGSARIGPGTAPEGAPPGTLAFANEVNLTNGTGSAMQAAPVPAVALHLRGHAVIVRVEAEGMQPVTRRVERSELVGEEPAIAVFLRPQ